jgi:ATP-dependent Clp protease ATP-binding subunit ClpB
MFKPLTMAEIIQIIDLILARTQAKLKEQNLSMDVTDAAKQYIASSSYSPVYGARPVKRYVQKNLEMAVARIIMRGELSEGSVIAIDADENGLVFSARQPVGV